MGCRRRVFLLVAVLLTGCGGDGGARGRDESPSAERCVATPHRWPGGSPRLVGWAWDEERPVPAVPRGAPLTLAHGAAGTSAATRAYLPLDAGVGEPRNLAPASSATPSSATPAPVTAPVTSSGWSWTAGRFGGGLALAPGGRLEVAELDLAQGWTVALWVRPTRGAGTLLDLPGVARVDVRADGRLTCAPEGDVLRVTTAGRVAFDTWNLVALVRDHPRPANLRLILNDEVVRLGLLHEPRPVDRVVVVAETAATLDDLLVEARAAPSSELFARRRGRVEAGPHRLGLRFEDGGTAERRTWAGLQTEPRLRDAEDWSLGHLRHVVADARGLTWAEGHWERDRPPAPPMPRTATPMADLGNGRVLLFSGEVKDSHAFPMVNLADTWIWDARARVWEEVEGSPVPPPRCHQPMATSPDHGLVLLCGGWENEAERRITRDDTWVFHVATRTWERRDPAGPALPRHSDASLVYLPGRGRFYLFLGEDVRTYDPVGNRWEVLPPAQVVDRSGAPANLDPGWSRSTAADPARDRVVFFGSERWEAGELVYRGATLVYDAQAHRFTVCAPESSPAPRVRSAFAHDPLRDRFVLFGGVRSGASRRFGDLWSYDPGADAWTPHRASNPPSRRGGYHGLAHDAERDTFVLVAGRHSRPVFLDETWRLRLDPAARGEASYLFDRSDFPDHTRVRVRWEGDAGVEVAVSGVDDPGDLPAEPGEVTADTRYVRVDLTLPPGSPAEGGVRVTELGLFPGPAQAGAAPGIEVVIPALR